MADFSLTDLQGAFEGALKTVFGGNSGSKTGSGSAADGDKSEGFTGVLKKLADAGPPVVAAFISLGAHGKEAATVFGQLAKFGSSIPGAGVLGGFVKSLEESRASIIAASKQGVGGTNLAEFSAQTYAAGMTMEGNLKLLKDMGPSLTGIGLNAQDANQRFLKLSKETIESGRGQELAASQGSVEGLNAAATIMAANTKKNLREDAQGRAELAQASAELAQQIDLQSRVTGKSRDVIEAELKERLKSPEAILAMNLMTDKQRQAFVATQTSLNAMGPSIGNLAQNIASGARLTKENQNVLNALGPAAGDFQRAIKMQQAATTDAEKQQAARALDAAKAKINEWQSSERYARLALQGSGEVAEAQKKLIGENKERAGVQKTAEETGQGYRQAQQTQQEIATREQAGKKGFGPQAGETDEGQTATRFINATQENFRKNAVAGATELVRLNDELGRSPNLLRDMAKGVEVLSGAYGETSEQKANRMEKGREALTEELTGTPAKITRQVSEGSRLNDITKQTLGSKEVFGDWFAKDWGKGGLSELHGKEAVVPEAKLPEFMKDMMGQMQTATSGIESTMSQKGNPLEQITKQLQSVKMPEIKMPQAPTNMLGQLEGQFKGLTAGMSNIKQPEFPKLPMLPKAPEVQPRKTETEKATEVANRRQVDNPDTGDTQRKKMETAPEDIQTKILDALNQLNKTMGQMVAHTSDISETSSKTARYAGKAGSRTAA